VRIWIRYLIAAAIGGSLAAVEIGLTIFLDAGILGIGVIILLSLAVAIGMIALPIFLGGAALTQNKDSRADLIGMCHNILCVMLVHAALCLGTVLVGDAAELMGRPVVRINGIVEYGDGVRHRNADFWVLFFLPIYVVIHGNEDGMSQEPGNFGLKLFHGIRAM
jgi:hypothetical protein